MKSDEAIKRLLDMRDDIGARYSYEIFSMGGKTDLGIEGNIEALEIGVAAAEKQKGRKCERVKLQEDIKIGNGTFRKGTSVCGKCPACESWVQIQDKYCRYCGQKLDWSDENE